MWQLSVSMQGLASNAAGPNVVELRPGGTAVVATAGSERLCTAVAPATRPPRIALVFGGSAGVFLGERKIPCPVVVFAQRGGGLVVRRDGREFAVTVTRQGLSSSVAGEDNLGHCCVCREPLATGNTWACPHCESEAHINCVVLTRDRPRCPTCRRRVDMRRVRAALDRAHPGVPIYGDVGENDPCAPLLRPPGPTVILVGCGNIGSKLATELPLLGVARLVLVDPDRVHRARNGRCCALFACPRADGQGKVDVVAAAVGGVAPDCETIPFAGPVGQLGVGGLRPFTPAILVGAVDSRSARQSLAAVANELAVPLVDLAIAGSPDQLVARVRVTWSQINGSSLTDAWSVRDWQMLDEPHPCSDSDAEQAGARPVASAISGHLAATLGLTQIRKLLAGDVRDVGYEIRANLGTASVVRCRLAGAAPGPAAQRPGMQAKHLRAKHDWQSLQALSATWDGFSARRLGPNVIAFDYHNTPGLLQHGHAVRVWPTWRAVIMLPPGYPQQGPTVLLQSVGTNGRPFHPNVKAESPQVVCYGAHLPSVLLDELAMRLRRMITLAPRSVMTKENDSLNPKACQYVRALTRAGKVPLSVNTPLPEVSMTQ